MPVIVFRAMDLILVGARCEADCCPDWLLFNRLALNVRISPSI